MSFGFEDCSLLEKPARLQVIWRSIILLGYFIFGRQHNREWKGGKGRESERKGYNDSLYTRYFRELLKNNTQGGTFFLPTICLTLFYGSRLGLQTSVFYIFITKTCLLDLPASPKKLQIYPPYSPRAKSNRIRSYSSSRPWRRKGKERERKGNATWLFPSDYCLDCPCSLWSQL